MGADDSKLIARFRELADRADRTGLYTNTKFLNAAEQSVLLRLRLPVKADLWGGYENAERRIAVFGSEETAGYEFTPPIECVLIRPANERFADELTHRDFLGSLMGLGVTRETLGDIIVDGNRGYVFCLDTVAGFICDSLREVRRTSVRCERAEPPKQSVNRVERRSCTVASERLDAIVSAVWKLSREEAKTLCEKELVFIDSRVSAKGGAQLNEGAVVSVRGYGRFRFLGIERETKKGRLRVTVEVFV